MVMEVNCSVSVAVVVQWQKKMYSSKTLELPKSKIVEENISATVAILQWFFFVAMTVTMVVP